MTAEFLRHLGLFILAASFVGGGYAVRDAHRRAREYVEAREDPGGHVRTLPVLFDQDARP